MQGKGSWAALAAITLCVAAPSVGRADTFTWLFDQEISGDSPEGGSPWASLTISDTGLNTVQFALTNMGVEEEFISRLFFNVLLDPATVTATNPVPADTFVSLGAGGTDAGLNWDLVIDLNTSTTGDRLLVGETFTVDLVANGLTAASFIERAQFNNGSGESPYYAMIQLQSIDLTDGNDNDGSAKLGAVPEPAAIAVFGIALAGLIRRRKASG